jgi:NAD(P)-dependent dehydrogenase (short-subunit alcohol dehydrogenase family)
MARRAPVAVVTGGGGGIGRAVAEELGRTGHFVVTVDPLVTVDGSEQLAPAEETTAERIVAAGGSARASSASVTDGPAVRQLFEELLAEHGRVDAVVNVAGITRPTSFTRGTEDDWRSVLSVHLDGYLNVLAAALPVLAGRGGRILGVTSGSGWRQADAGAYACAKRAVASLTWQLGEVAPPEVVVNAMSPIAATRMVTAALGRARASSPSGPSGPSGRERRTGSGTATAASGGLSLGSMPAPEEIGPIGAHLVREDLSWCRGQVIFAGGSEVAVIDRPRLVEAARTDDTASLAGVLDTWLAGAAVPAEATQATTGGSNPRFGGLYDPSGASGGSATASGPSLNCAVVSDRPDLAAAVAAALGSRGATARVVPVETTGGRFADAADVVRSIAGSGGPLDALVVALAAGPAAPGGAAWERILAEHADVAGGIASDAAWARAIADHATATDRPVQLLTLSDARSSGGRSRAQASAQLARSARTATHDRVTAYAVSLEGGDAASRRVAGDLAAHLLCSPGTESLSGSELVVSDGWIGIRRHPHPSGSVTFGGPSVPAWLDTALREMVARARDDGDRP